MYFPANYVYPKRKVGSVGSEGRLEPGNRTISDVAGYPNGDSESPEQQRYSREASEQLDTEPPHTSIVPRLSRFDLLIPKAPKHDR